MMPVPTLVEGEADAELEVDEVLGLYGTLKSTPYFKGECPHGR